MTAMFEISQRNGTSVPFAFDFAEKIACSFSRRPTPVYRRAPLYFVHGSLLTAGTDSTSDNAPAGAAAAIAGSGGAAPGEQLDTPNATTTQNNAFFTSLAFIERSPHCNGQFRPLAPQFSATKREACQPCYPCGKRPFLAGATLRIVPRSAPNAAEFFHRIKGAHAATARRRAVAGADRGLWTLTSSREDGTTP